MSHNTFGHIFRVTTFGESHGPALGCVVDGCPSRIPLDASDIQAFLDLRRPGQSRFTTQRQEPDAARILSGVMVDDRTGVQMTTGTPIALLIENTDQRSRDYGEIKDAYRPGHADYVYDAKYGLRDYRGGGRSSARETAARVAAGAIARKIIPGVTLRAAMIQVGPHKIDRRRWDWDEVARNGLFCPDAVAAAQWADYLDDIRKKGSSVGAVLELVAEGVPAGWGAPVYAKLDADLAGALMSINAVKGVEIGDGFAAAELTGEENADEMRAGNDGPLLPITPEAYWEGFAVVASGLDQSGGACQQARSVAVQRHPQRQGQHAFRGGGPRQRYRSLEPDSLHSRNVEGPRGHTGQ